MKDATAARAIRGAFASFRTAIEVARDLDEPRDARAKALTRAASARARIARELARLERSR